MKLPNNVVEIKAEEVKKGDWILFSTNTGGWVREELEGEAFRITKISHNSEYTVASIYGYIYGSINTSRFKKYYRELSSSPSLSSTEESNSSGNARCPLCGSPGDLLLDFYCHNKSCPNYR